MTKTSLASLANRDFKQQKDQEELAAWLIEYITGKRVILMPEYSKFDFVIATTGVDATVIAVCEYRNRPDTPKSRYPSIVLDVGKVKDIHTAAKLMDVKRVLFVVQWMNSEPEWASIAAGAPYLEEARQFTRNTQQRQGDDTRLVYDIPISAFKKF